MKKALLLIFISFQASAISITSKNKNTKFVIEMGFNCNWHHTFWPTIKNNNYNISFDITIDEHTDEIKKYTNEDIFPLINKVVFIDMYENVTNKLEQEYASLKKTI